ncbi:MAG: sulfatase-like hydrolase/transferase [Planctomycetota bacterium]|jgi:arylsulfatase A-like enzyme|nr:sulfatase-like hydrolase/transferase [Planctomycetota bacterium]MDP7250415.1 sulfatase-like hydrolase/transferase [Planctomycetota bacterium]
MPQPNILVFMTDDHGQWAANCYGTTEIISPTMDYLARNGAKMNRAFTPTPVCSPARASFFTGRLPSQHGIHDYIHERGEGLQHPGIYDQTNIGQLLQQAGYQTALTGKWHCSQSWKPHPGFDRWFSYYDAQYPHRGMQRFSDEGELVEQEGHQSQLITDQTIQFLRNRDRERPFFTFVGYVNTHTPHKDMPERLADHYRQCTFDEIPRESFPDCHGDSRFEVDDYDAPDFRESLAQYYAAVTAIDEQMGRVLDELEATGYLENTLVVYTADHGLMMGHHGTRLKGNGTTPQNFLEESILVPCLLSWPGKIAPGQECNELVDHIDLFQTVLDAACATPPAETIEEIDSPGSSYLPLISGDEEDWRDAFFGEYGNARVIRTKTHKLIKRYIGPNGIDYPDELYDLINDPRETGNIIGEEAAQDVVKALEERLEKHFSRYEKSECSGLRLDEQPIPNSAEPWRREG